MEFTLSYSNQNISVNTLLRYLFSLRQNAMLYVDCRLVTLVEMSHSIHMWSIQIDTKNYVLVYYHQFNNIKLSFLQTVKSRVFHYVRLLDPARVRLLDTLKDCAFLNCFPRK